MHAFDYHMLPNDTSEKFFTESRNTHQIGVSVGVDSIMFIHLILRIM